MLKTLRDEEGKTILSEEQMAIYRDFVSESGNSVDSYQGLVEVSNLHKKQDNPLGWAEEMLSAAEWVMEIGEKIDEMSEEGGWTHYKISLLIRNLHGLGVNMLITQCDEAGHERWLDEHQ